MSKKFCIVLLGSSSVIGNAIASKLQEFFEFPVLRVRRITKPNEKNMRIYVSKTDASAEIFLQNLNSFIELKNYLRQNELVIQSLIVSSGYMSESRLQLDYIELMKTFDANVAYPISGVTELASELINSSNLIFLSSSLNHFPLQRKHYNYQLSKEYADSLLFQYLELADRQFSTFIVRPGHVASKLNNHIPTKFSSIKPEYIGDSVLRRIQNGQVGSNQIQNIYVPNFLRAFVLISRVLPRFVLEQIFRKL